ncbi:MAG TPA: helix-turn-helix domain-containing protein [Woeseiaceae bacterium]
MNEQINLYGVVMQRLRSRRISQREIASGSGVPFSTVAKIAQGDVENPSVHTVQKLYDYFRDRPEFSERAKPQEGVCESALHSCIWAGGELGVSELRSGVDLRGDEARRNEGDRRGDLARRVKE